MYPRHRRFLPTNHVARKKGKHFEGEADHRPTPVHRSGDEVFAMVKDLYQIVTFGKGHGSQSVPNDDNGHAPMWKKKSIFWELPYWKVLEFHSTIDVILSEE